MLWKKNLSLKFPLFNFMHVVIMAIKNLTAPIIQMPDVKPVGVKLVKVVPMILAIADGKMQLKNLEKIA